MPLHIPTAVTVSRLDLIEEIILSENAGEVEFTGLSLNSSKVFELLITTKSVLSARTGILINFNGDETRANYSHRMIETYGGLDDKTGSGGYLSDIQRAYSYVNIYARITMDIDGLIYISSRAGWRQPSGIAAEELVEGFYKQEVADLTEIKIRTVDVLSFNPVVGLRAGSNFKLFGYKEE